MPDPQPTPPAGGAQPPAPSQGDSESSRIKTLDDRFGAIETEQKEQRSILSRIESALTGGSPKASGPGSATPSGATGGAQGTPPDSSGLSVAEQVRRGVEEIEARKQKEAADKAAADSDQAWRKSVDDRLAERKPAEPRTGRKTKLQHALFGKQDDR